MSQRSGQGSSGRARTPPRSAAGSAPARILRICFDNRVLGGVEVDDHTTLAEVRRLIEDDEIPGVPEQGYEFLFGGAPVSRRQEGRRRAGDCFPFLTIIPLGHQVSATTSRAESRPTISGVGEWEPLEEQRAVDSVDLTRAGEVSNFSEDELARLARAPTLDGEGRSVEGDLAMATQLLGTGSNDANRHSVSLSSDEHSLERLELHVMDGPLEGTTFTVGAEGARVGRHTSNTLVIPEAGISRFHCEIQRSPEGFAIRDLGSTTGTFFYLKPHCHFAMFVGLMVKLGESEFQVVQQTVDTMVLLFYEGPLAGQKTELNTHGLTIGRRHNNGLVMAQDGTISAHHAMITCEDGEFFIVDLGSCNGTCIRLSMERAESGWHPILDGDIVGAGCTKVRCRLARDRKSVV